MLQDWAKWHATTYQTEVCLHCSFAIQVKHLSLLPVQFAHDGHFESGRYEYAPATIAAEDITVLVDKPELQKVQTKIAANFNLQYETVRPLGQYAVHGHCHLLVSLFAAHAANKQPLIICHAVGK